MRRDSVGETGPAPSDATAGCGPARGRADLGEAGPGPAGRGAPTPPRPSPSPPSTAPIRARTAGGAGLTATSYGSTPGSRRRTSAMSTPAARSSDPAVRVLRPVARPVLSERHASRPPSCLGVAQSTTKLIRFGGRTTTERSLPLSSHRLHLRCAPGQPLDLGRRHGGRHLDAMPDLSVHLDDQGDRSLRRQRLIP